VGEYKNGKRDGQGTSNQNGVKYVGKWKNGKQHGQGKMTLSDGDTLVGQWKDGNPWNGIEYDNNGKITGKVENGKYIKQ